MWHTHTHTHARTHAHKMEYYAAIKNEILPFAMTSIRENQLYDLTVRRNLRNKTEDHRGREEKMET